MADSFSEVQSTNLCMHCWERGISSPCLGTQCQKPAKLSVCVCLMAYLPMQVLYLPLKNQKSPALVLVQVPQG